MTTQTGNKTRRRSSHLRRHMLFGLASALLVSGCVDTSADIDEASLSTTEQAIYFGTRTPQVVSMSSGQQMAIGYLADPFGNQFCSGTLISRNVVVTASHCTEGSSASSMQFAVGSPERPDGMFQVSWIAEHPTMDAALLILADDVVSAVPSVQPLPYLTQPLSNSLIGGRVEASGYGQTHDNSVGRYFASLTLDRIDSEYYVVNGHGQQGICFGDSGGPLLVSVGGSTVVAGVESHGDSSCVDVDNLTRLDLVADWIAQNGAAGAQPSTPSEPNGKPPVDAPDGPSSFPNSPTGPSSSPDDDWNDDGDFQGEGGGSDDPFGGLTLGCSVADGQPSHYGLALLVPAVIVATRRRRRRS